ncbi:MAG TPA: DUF4340 domain-containing protein [Myxococcales bacterium]|nr:DUF4340 domain-containing protein [Myxococcales bacterium]
MAMTQKQKTLSTLLVTASVAAALGSYAWFGVYQKTVAEQKKKEEQNTLFSFKKDEVKKLSVTAKGETTTVERDGAEWKITAPIQTRADKLSVEAMVDKIAGLKRKRGIEGVSDLGAYGLEKPKIAVEVTLDSGKTEKVSVGADNAYDGTLFVSTSDSPDVDVCEAALKYPLDKSLFDLRDKHVFDFDDADLSELDVVTPNLSYSLARHSTTDWKILSPIQEKADSAKGQQMASALKNLRATRFASEQASAEDLKRFGLDHPGYTVSVTIGKDAAQKTLTLAEVKEGSSQHVYAKRAADPWIAEVPTSILKDLDVTTMDLRDKTILAFHQEDATGLSFTATATTGTITFGAERHRSKTDAGFGPDSWTMAAPQTGDAKRWKASSILSTLESIKGSSIVSEKATAAELAKWGLDEPKKIARVLGAGGKVIAELDIGKIEGNKIWVKSAESPRVFQVDAYRITQIPSTPAELEETTPTKTTTPAPKTAKR